MLAPLIQPFLAEYPGIHLEVSVDDTHGDIVSGRFDAGIRVGRRIERDMTILRLYDDFRMLAVAAPSYLARHPAPSVPKDLHTHNCIRFRFPWDGSIQPWVFVNGRQHAEIAVEGSFTVNDFDLLLSTALDGVGISYLAEPLAAPYLAEGRLVALLEGWSFTLPGIFLYHPSRRQAPMPLLVFLKFIKKWRRRIPAANGLTANRVI